MVQPCLPDMVLGSPPAPDRNLLILRPDAVLATHRRGAIPLRYSTSEMAYLVAMPSRNSLPGMPIVQNGRVHH
jgi:hypothetical protein